MADPKHDSGAEAFSPIEEEFFRAGDALDAAADDAGSAHDAAPVRTGVWSRLFKRTSRRTTERPLVAAPPPAASAVEDDWAWQIALARARHSTSS